MKLFQLTILLLFSLASTIGAFSVQDLKGVQVKSLSDNDRMIDIGDWLSSKSSSSKDRSRKLVIFGTYAADFNAIEYGQRLRYYWPQLQAKGIDQCAFLLSCQPTAARKLLQQVDLPTSKEDGIEVWTDNVGQAARVFGVQRGWLPDNDNVNPFLKLFGMLWGLGAWATLPAVIGGYIGNPFVAQPWIEDALAVGQQQGRWPDMALELSTTSGKISPEVVTVNKFKDLPLVGSWPRRPLELATLRLQSMMGISLANWDDLAPDQEALDAGVLTQLGGCMVVETDGTTTKPIYEWRDPGICAVANFELMLKQI